VLAAHETHDAPAEPGAREAGTERARVHERIDERVELGRGDVEVVAQARMALEQQRAEGIDVTPLEGVREGENPRVLRDHVPSERIVAHLLERRVA
jgi:hypothetical protein